MSGADSFFDTSVLLYLLSSDSQKADRVEALLAESGTISVQALNEFTAVASRKLKMPLVHAGCKILYSDDLQHGQMIDEHLRITNPFEVD